MKERTISIRSFSKDYCMTGWRIGYVIAPKEIIQIMKDVNENNVFTAPSISQRAALHALRMRKEIQPGIIEEFKNRAYYAYERIREIPYLSVLIEEFKNRAYYAYERIREIPYLSVLEPRGSLYLFVNIKKTGSTSREFCDKLLNEHHILAIPGDAFGKSGEGYIRIALTVGVNKLKEAFDRLL